MSFPGTFVSSMPAIVSASNLQFPAEIVNPGAYMSLSTNGDSLKTNLTLGTTLSNMSVVYITKTDTVDTRENFITFYNASDEFAGSVAFAGYRESLDRRFGVTTVDGTYNRRTTNNHYGSNTWEVVAASMDALPQANNYDLIGVGGVNTGNGTGNGAGATTTFPDTTNLPIHIGWPGSSSSNVNGTFDVAMVRIYKRILTITEFHDIFDHWVDNNEIYYTNNSESVPAHADGAADYTTDLYAEWDFSKMPTGVLQTTQGSAGLVVGSLTGGAVVTT